MNFKMKYGPGRRRAYLRISCPHKNLAVSKKKGDTHLLLPSFLLPTRQMTSDSAGKRRERVRPCLHRERDPIKKFAPLLLHLTTHTRQRGDDGKKFFFAENQYLSLLATGPILGLPFSLFFALSSSCLSLVCFLSPPPLHIMAYFFSPWHSLMEKREGGRERERERERETAKVAALLTIRHWASSIICLKERENPFHSTHTRVCIATACIIPIMWSGGDAKFPPSSSCFLVYR